MERFSLKSGANLFLIKDDKILLLRRYNTGYGDGQYNLPAGHLDGNEKATDAMVREVFEEAGIVIRSEDLKFVHVMHRNCDAEVERIHFFFTATKWEGEPRIGEPQKCDDLKWFSLNSLPENFLAFERAALENYQKGISYSEFGW